MVYGVIGLPGANAMLVVHMDGALEIENATILLQASEGKPALVKMLKLESADVKV